ncbi:MAG: hypothetical protein ABIE07_04630 [Candidatus Zixiibacteriota bacterium]
MAEKIEKIKKEIEQLEKEINTNHFGRLFDKSKEAKDHKRLKKLRKELIELEKTS